MKNLGYIKKYLFETIKPQAIHQYFLIDELLNNQDQKFDDLVKKFKQKFDSDKSIKELKTELMDIPLKELSSHGIAKLENGKLVAEFTLKPKSLIDSLHWVIEKSIEGYLYKPNQEEKTNYKDVISNLKKKHSPKALKPQGKVIYRNANAIMWTLGYIMESRQNGKATLSKNYAIDTLGFPKGPSTWSQYVRWLTWFGLTDRTFSSTEIKLNKAGEELLKLIENNFTVEELKTWSDKPIPEEIKKIYFNQLCSFDINSKSLATEFTVGSKQIFILLNIAQDGKFFDIRDEENGTKQQKEIAFEYLDWPKDSKVDFFGWWGKGMSDIGLVQLKDSFYELTDLGKQLIEDIREKNTPISNKNELDFSRRNFYFDTNPYISSEIIEKFCLEHNIQEHVVRDIVQSIHYGQKQIVLTGPPGTGKTFILDKITKLFESDDQNKEFVQFHPSYGYEDFVEGLVPDTKDGNLVFVNKDGSLKKFLKLNNEKNQKINFYLKNLEDNSNTNNNQEIVHHALLRFDPFWDKLSVKDYHQEVIDSNGYVWWGKYYKSKRIISEEKVKIYKNQIDKNIPTYVYFLENKPGTDLYKSKLLDISDDFNSIDDENIPIYYRDAAKEECEVFFKIDGFEKVNKEKTLEELRKSSEPEKLGGVNNALRGSSSYLMVCEENISEKSELGNLSWVLDEHTRLVKFVDYSIFEHNTSTIPKEFYSFFSLTGDETKVNIQLEDEQGKLYSSYIRTASKSRSTPAKLIKWNKDFDNFLKSNIPKWEEIKKGESQEKYGLFFTKTELENTYKIAAGEISKDQISHSFTNNHSKQPPLESFGESIFLIIDEINRGNLPRIFGELLNLFEYRDEEVTLQYSKSKFSLPSNLYFFGSMNTADRSIKGIDAALRRRFDFINVEPNYEILNKHLESKFSEVNNIAQGLNNLNQQLFQDLKDKSYLIGHTFFMSDQEKITIDEFKAIWNRKIYPQLEEYFFDEPGKLINYKIENFWPVELEKNSIINEKKYKLEILEKDLAEINLELKDEFNKIVNWSKNYKEFDIFLGRREDPSFTTGGVMFIYKKNLETEGNKKRKNYYHLFRITGKGKFEFRLKDLYESKYTRAPFNKQNFRDEFEKKLQKLFQINNIQIEDDFFEKAYPGVPLESLVENNCVDQMLSIWDWVIMNIEEF